MIAGAFCTSTSLAIPPAPGSCSSCEKLFPTIPRPDFSYSTMTRSMAWKCQDHDIGRTGQQDVFERRRLKEAVIGGVDQQVGPGEGARHPRARTDRILID